MLSNISAKEVIVVIKYIVSKEQCKGLFKCAKSGHTESRQVWQEASCQSWWSWGSSMKTRAGFCSYSICLKKKKKNEAWSTELVWEHNKDESILYLEVKWKPYLWGVA